MASSKQRPDLAAELRSIFRERLELVLDRLAAGVPREQELSKHALARALHIERDAQGMFSFPGRAAALADLLQEDAADGAKTAGEVLDRLRQQAGEMAERAASNLAEHVLALGLPPDEAEALAVNAARPALGRSAVAAALVQFEPEHPEAWLWMLTHWFNQAPPLPENEPLPVEEWSHGKRWVGLANEADTRTWMGRTAPEVLARIEHRARIAWGLEGYGRAPFGTSPYGGVPAGSPSPPLPAIWQVLRAAWLELHPEERARATMERLAAPDDPLPVHHALARGAAGEAPSEARDRLARELGKRLHAALHPLGLDGPPMASEVAEQGMLWLDARAAAVLDGIGPEGKRLARTLQQEARPRWRSGEDLWTLWKPLPMGDGIACRFAELLARSVWLDLPEMAKAAAAAALVPDTRTVSGGDQYAKIDKPMAGLSWSIGGAAIKLDGESYAPAPAGAPNALYLPRTWELLPRDAKERPHQRSFAFAFAERPEPATLAIAALTDGFLSPLAGKWGVLLLACGDRMTAGPLRDATMLLQPGKKRYQPRDDQATARALCELDALSVFLPNGTDFRAFNILKPSDPERVAPDMIVGGCKGAFFQALMAGLQQYKSLRGAFLINLTRFLALDNRSAVQQRYYLRSAAAWNDARNPGGGGRFNPARLQPVTLEEWARRCNALSPGAVEYLKAGRTGAGSRKVAASVEVAKVRADLEALEGDKLLVLEKAGRNAVKILPPPALHEAWDLFRNPEGKRE